MSIERVSVAWELLPWEFGYEYMKNYLRIFDDAANSEHAVTVDILIKAAIEAIQTYTRQVFIRSTYRKKFDSLPAKLPAFPVISITKAEYYTDSWHDLTIANQEIDQAFEAYSTGSWKCYLENSQPAELKGQPVTSANAYRLTWEAGMSDWPKDLILLVMQMVSENFDVRGVSDTKAINFTRSHELALQQYCTHHDAMRWA